MARGSTDHVWQFFRASDFEQVALTSGADLLALDKLDQKLWAALGCPVQGLRRTMRRWARSPRRARSPFQR